MPWLHNACDGMAVHIYHQVLTLSSESGFVWSRLTGCLPAMSALTEVSRRASMVGSSYYWGVFSEVHSLEVMYYCSYAVMYIPSLFRIFNLFLAPLCRAVYRGRGLCQFLPFPFVLHPVFFFSFSHTRFGHHSRAHSHSAILTHDLVMTLVLILIQQFSHSVWFSFSLSSSFFLFQFIAEGTCVNTCQHARDGYCDDPRSGGVCPSGTDCQVRQMGCLTVMAVYFLTRDDGLLILDVLIGDLRYTLKTYNIFHFFN